MSVSCRDIAALECPQILLGPFEGFVLETSCTTVNCTIRDKSVYFHDAQGGKDYMGKAAQERTPRDLFFTSEEVADSSSHFCILQRGWLNSAKTEKYSLLCRPWWEKQMRSCAFAWSRS